MSPCYEYILVTLFLQLLLKRPAKIALMGEGFISEQNLPNPHMKHLLSMGTCSLKGSNRAFTAVLVMTTVPGSNPLKVLKK